MAPLHLLRSVALAALALSSAIAIAQEVGTAGAVNPATTGTPPARATRVLELGSRVVFRERVNTTAGGNAQLIFLDKTTMSIGPNSQVVIDEFVYDPNAGTGRLTASVAKGVLRYVGGNISHSGGAQIRTPAATLGIRGGSAHVEVICRGRDGRPIAAAGRAAATATCDTRVTNLSGEVRIDATAGGSEVIRRPGFTVTVAAGNSPSAPVRVAQGDLDDANRSLTSRPGQTGGGRAPAGAVARANVAGPVIAQIGPGLAGLQSQNQARQETATSRLALSLSPTDALTASQLPIAVSDIRQQALTQRTQRVAGDMSNDNPIAVPSAVPARAFALALGIDPALGSPAAYLPAAFVAPGRFENSPVLGYGVGGTNPGGGVNTTRRVLQAGLNIDGAGSAQTSTIYVMTGASLVSAQGRRTFDGGFTGTTRLAASSGAGRATGGLVGQGNDVTLDGELVPTRLTASSGAGDGNAIRPEQAMFRRGNGTAAEAYSFTQTATVAATPTGLGSNRPTVNLSGFATAIGRSSAGAGSVATDFPVEAVVGAQLDTATDRFGAVISAANVGPRPGVTLQSALLRYGDTGAETVPNRGTYVDYDYFGAREARNEGAAGGSPSTVDGGAVTGHRGVFVTSQSVNAPSFFPGVNFCRCEFTRWGFWSSDTERSTAGLQVRDTIHLGTWVAGQTITSAEMPRTGSAAYSGHVIANIQNGGSNYIAAGNLSNTVNFGTGRGAAAVTGLDGRSYAGGLTVPSGNTGVFGNLPVTAGAPAGTGSLELIGQFYRGAAGPAGEMAGGARIVGGPDYLGRGTFAASAPRIGP